MKNLNNYIKEKNIQLKSLQKVLDINPDAKYVNLYEDYGDKNYNSQISFKCNQIASENDSLLDYNKNFCIYSDFINEKSSDICYDYLIENESTSVDVLYSYNFIDGNLCFYNFIMIDTLLEELEDSVLKIKILENLIPQNYNSLFKEYLRDIIIDCNLNVKIDKALENKEYWESYIKTLEVFQ